MALLDVKHLHTFFIFCFPVVIYGFRAIELGLEVKIQKGDTTVEIHKDDDDDTNQ